MVARLAASATPGLGGLPRLQAALAHAGDEAELMGTAEEAAVARLASVWSPMLFPDAAQLVDYSSMNASSRSAAATRRAQRRSSQHAPRRRRSGASVASMASEAEAPLVSAHDHAGAFSADSAIGGSLNLHNGLYMASKDAVLVTDHAKWVDSAPETVSTHLTWHDACFLPAVCVDGRRFAATFLAAVDDDLAREKSARIAAHEALVDKMHKALT